jgi:hypothetical protein
MKLFIKTSGIVDSCDSNINWNFFSIKIIKDKNKNIIHKLTMVSSTMVTYYSSYIL